jgi:hypothetical protein
LGSTAAELLTGIRSVDQISQRKIFAPTPRNCGEPAGAGAHDVFPAPDGQSGSPRNPRANSAGSIPGPGNRI